MECHLCKLKRVLYSVHADRCLERSCYPTPAIWLTSSKATSPTTWPPPSPSSTTLMPTSMTTAPGFTQSAFTISGLPTATTNKSARLAKMQILSVKAHLWRALSKLGELACQRDAQSKQRAAERCQRLLNDNRMSYLGGRLFLGRRASIASMTLLGLEAG